MVNEHNESIWTLSHYRSQVMFPDDEHGSGAV